MSSVKLTISFNLYTPDVSTIPPSPEVLWNVFKVIYVNGSPIDYAAIIPTFSPA